MKAPKRDRVGATPGKLALVGVLALVLVYVLASNFRGAPPVDAAPAGEAAAAEPDGAAEPIDVTGADPFGEFAEDRHWEQPLLESLVSFDPLAAPPWMAVHEQSGSLANGPDVKSLDDLRNAASAIVIIADGQRVARIGSQDYHVGDLIGPYQITDITAAGIVLGQPTRER